MRVCSWASLSVLMALIAVLALRIIGARSWPIELFNHFVFQYLLGAILLSLAFAVMRRKGLAALALMLAVAFAVDHRQTPHHREDNSMLRGGTASASVADDSKKRWHSLSLITSNLYVLNRRQDDVLAWLATRPAEVVVLQELPNAIRTGLEKLREVYPYQFIVEPGTPLNSGVYMGRESMGIVSVHPIVATEAPGASIWRKLALKARLSISGAVNPWIVAVHPSYPVNRARLSARDVYLSEIAAVVANLEGPVVVAGDFNTTPYAPVFRDFLDASGTSTFQDFPATWPAALGPLGIPIDHILVRGARLIDLTALASIGSDHRGLKAKILLPPLINKLGAAASR